MKQLRMDKNVSFDEWLFTTVYLLILLREIFGILYSRRDNFSIFFKERKKAENAKMED